MEYYFSPQHRALAILQPGFVDSFHQNKASIYGKSGVKKDFVYPNCFNFPPSCFNLGEQWRNFPPSYSNSGEQCFNFPPSCSNLGEQCFNFPPSYANLDKQRSFFPPSCFYLDEQCFNLVEQCFNLVEKNHVFPLKNKFVFPFFNIPTPVNANWQSLTIILEMSEKVLDDAPGGSG